MKKYINLAGEMDDDMISEIVEFCNDLKEQDSATVFFGSAGGATTVPNIISEIVNENKQIEKVIFSWEISSSAFAFMLKTMPEKRVISNTVYAGLHIASRTMSTRDLIGKLPDGEMFIRKDLDYINKATIELFKNIGLSEDEIKKIEEGETVYLDYERVLEAVRLFDENKDSFREKLVRF